jgi:hypothetical protein
MANIENIINTIKQENPQLNSYEFINCDDRKHIEIGNFIKYINIKNLKKIHTGKVIKITNNLIILKSINSDFTWSIKFVDNYIFCKFETDTLMETINKLFNNNI